MNGKMEDKFMSYLTKGLKDARRKYIKKFNDTIDYRYEALQKKTIYIKMSDEDKKIIYERKEVIKMLFEIQMNS